MRHNKRDKQDAVAMFEALVRQGKNIGEAVRDTATKFEVSESCINQWRKKFKPVAQLTEQPALVSFELKDETLPPAVAALLHQTCTQPWGVRLLTVNGEEWFVARLFRDGREVRRIAGLVMEAVK